MVWTGSIWLRIGTSGEGSCEDGDEPSGSLKLLGIFRVAAQLAASQEGLSSVSKQANNFTQEIARDGWSGFDFRLGLYSTVSYTGFEAHPASCTVGSGGSFPGGKASGALN
jgi:hypothetical protein